MTHCLNDSHVHSLSNLHMSKRDSSDSLTFVNDSFTDSFMFKRDFQFYLNALTLVNDSSIDSNTE